MGGGSAVKHLPASAKGAGDVGSIPGLGRPLGERNGNPLQYSCLGSPRDRGARWATVYGVAKELDTTWRLHGNNKRHIGDSVCVCVCACACALMPLHPTLLSLEENCQAHNLYFDETRMHI